MLWRRMLWRRPPALAIALLAIGAASAVSCAAYNPNDPEQGAELEQMLGAPVTVSFQDGVLPTSSYAGTSDASIKQATASTNYGSATSLEADGDASGGVDKSGLIKWTLSGIPAGNLAERCERVAVGDCRCVGVDRSRCGC